MNNLLYYIFAPASDNLIHYAVCFMRISIGALMVVHGAPKIYEGVETWRWLGGAMAHFGITWWPILWGLCAACAEFFGGMALMAGCGTRIAAVLLVITMIVALSYHLHKGDSFIQYSHALALLVVFCTFAFLGGGIFSVDNYIFAFYTN